MTKKSLLRISISQAIIIWQLYGLQVKFQHQRFNISCAILLLSAVLIQPNMHLVEQEYAPSAWKFTINPDTFINFVVKGKAMRRESLSHYI